MAKYETTIVDLEADVQGVYQKTVVPLPVKSSRSWIWKTFAVIVFLGLCAAASVFFACHLTDRKQNKSENPILSGEQIGTPSEHVKVLHQIAERTKAAIHLHGGVGEKSLKWVSGVDQSFEQGGLELIDNNIRIPADGLYFVYSQVAYGVPCKVGEDGETQKFLSHNILRISDEMGGQMPLQDSGHSICQSGENEMTYSTIYLGAVFKLLQGDRLSTSTNYVDYIDDDSSKTFFGVFAL
ncbi:tumor necrosis factor b (TNF superfamily, member 2) [Triplophysa rosa]|uniref:tumor necrosis factor b (TNF superfamily, member 2) n=1 Tax=Triplophysa rosa TaxID=992332 RepID=UPI002545C2E0|nr:tumor necrosis factor b (TNF superfamily, member 2) [Triplophysa rosa]